MTPIMRQIITWDKIYALDGFERADVADGLGNAQTGQAWSAVTGTWGVSSGKAYNSTALSGDKAIISIKSPKHKGQVDIYSSNYNNYYPGVLVGYVNANNYIRIRPEGNDIKLMKCVSGVNTAIASVTVGFASTQTYTISWRKYFDRIMVGVNGVWVIDYSLTVADAIALYGSNLGIMAGGVDTANLRWDNLKIKSL